jgi:hypothetical protein
MHQYISISNMMKLHNPKSYSLITGTILFLLGFLGFAFRGSFNVPDSYLLLSLILGFWGIVVGLGGRKNP